MNVITRWYDLRSLWKVVCDFVDLQRTLGSTLTKAQLAQLLVQDEKMAMTKRNRLIGGTDSIYNLPLI